jgi:hypothetical protein
VSAPRWEQDGRLLADLRAALPGRHPSLAEYAESALAAFVIGRTDAGVAELVFDSALDPEPAGLTRASSSARLLAFRADGYAVDVEVGEDELLGQVYPDGAGVTPVGSVTGQTVHGEFGESALDDVGGFALPLPPAGPIRLRARVGERTIVTSWLVFRNPDARRRRST